MRLVEAGEKINVSKTESETERDLEGRVKVV